MRLFGYGQVLVERGRGEPMTEALVRVDDHLASDLVFFDDLFPYVLGRVADGKEVGDVSVRENEAEIEQVAFAIAREAQRMSASQRGSAEGHDFFDLDTAEHTIGTFLLFGFILSEKTGEEPLLFLFILVFRVEGRVKIANCFGDRIVDRTIGDRDGHKIYLRRGVRAGKTRGVCASEGVDRPKIEPHCGHKADKFRVGAELSAKLGEIALFLGENGRGT